MKNETNNTLETELEQAKQRIAELESAIRNFCHRCEIGEIRSRKTYAEFCALLEKAKQ